MKLLRLRKRLTHSRSMRAILLLAAVFLIGNVTGEELVKRSLVDETQKTQYEKNLEDRIARDIESYLGHKFFIVRADALLEKLDRYKVEEIEIKTPLPPKPAPPPQQQAQPEPEPEPQAQEQEENVLEQMELETEDGLKPESIRDALGLEQPLPGLPLSANVFERVERGGIIQRDPEPKAERKPKPKPKAKPEPPPPPPPPPEPEFKIEKKKVETLIDSRVETKKLLVKVLVDEHVTDEQENFLRNIVIDKAGINFLRGDELKMLRSKFPGAAVLDPPIEEPVAEEVVEEPPKEEPPPPQAEEQAKDPLEEWLTQNWPLLLAGLVILGLLLLLLVRRKAKQEPPQPQVIYREDPNKHSKIDELISKMSAKEDFLNENRIQAIREELVSMAVTDFTVISEQIKEWLSTGNTEDIDKVAALQYLLGHQFINLFRTILDPESLVVITARGQQQEEEMQAQERLGLVESVYQSLMQKQYKERHGVEHEIRPFSFMDKLNDDQIMYLIRSEDIKVKALVLSQLQPERAANLLKRGSAAEKARLATEVSMFRNLPVEAFRDVANRLARRAINVPSFAHIEVDGVDLLSDMLDHMPTADETALLTALKQDSPDLFYQIKKVYISFTDLYRLPKLALRNLVREVSREQLALALFDMPEAYQNAIFDAMLERPRAMLINTMRGLNSPDEKTVEDAKRMVARKARELLKAGAISLTDPNAEKSSKGAAA